MARWVAGSAARERPREEGGGVMVVNFKQLDLYKTDSDARLRFVSSAAVER